MWKYVRACLTIYCLVVSLLVPANAQTSTSILKEGEWLKIPVTQSGVYKISKQLLGQAGWQVDRIDPRTFRLYGNGGQMLPQPITSQRSYDLVENAIEVLGEDDGQFDDQDLLLFYGQGPQQVTVDPSYSYLQVQNNIYTDTTYYYLTHANQLGKRVGNIATDQLPKEAVETVNSFTDLYYHELNQTNILESGREWWGEYIAAKPTGWQVRLADIITNSEAIFSTQVMVGAPAATNVSWTVNTQTLGQQSIQGVPQGRYALRGRKSFERFQFKANPINDVLFFEVTYDAKGQNSAQAYLDFFTLQVQRRLTVAANQQSYFLLSNQTEKPRQLQFQEPLPNDCLLWDITSIESPKFVPVDLATSTTPSYTTSQRFQHLHSFSVGNAYEPPFLQKVANQDLKALPTPNLAIIVAPPFLQEAQRLADFRRSHDNLEVEVVTTEQVYNEFSSGKMDVTAIRDFIRFLYQKEPNRLHYVLLFGDATYDYKSYKKSSLLPHFLVPTYQSRESLDPLTTYTSDDYYGFLKEQDGEWEENERGDARMDVGVGRLPVKSVTEARVVVDKLIHYATGAETKGNWKNKAVFVADDGDGNLHESHAVVLSNLVESTLLPTYLFNDAYQPVVSGNERRLPTLNADLLRVVNEGAAIVNFSGHGDASTWTQEQIFTLEEIQTAKGYHNLPLFITATCEFGRYDNPWVTSGAEQLVLSARGGAIGAITTTRPVYASSNFAMNQAFYKALSSNARTVRLGDLFKHTKNESLKGSLNRNLTLLADPSMQLAMGQQSVRWSVLPDTLHSLQEHTLLGEVLSLENDNQVDVDFNGKAYVEIYAPKSLYETYGNNGPKGSYTQFQKHLYKGQVKVSQGRFVVHFQMPNGETVDLEEGRVSIYAVTEDHERDAASQLPIYVQQKKVDVQQATEWKVTGYLERPSFQQGDQVMNAPEVHITVQASYPLDLANQGIQAILDDSIRIELSDYYWTRIASASTGDLQYKLPVLNNGKHHLIIIFTDVYNNRFEKSFSFIVEETGGITLQESIVYPNPFEDEIGFKIRHSRPGDDLNVTFTLYNQDGKVLFSEKKSYSNSSESISERYIPFKNQKKYPSYIYEIRLESLMDHAETRKTGWLLNKL